MLSYQNQVEVNKTIKRLKMFALEKMRKKNKDGAMNWKAYFGNGFLEIYMKLGKRFYFYLDYLSLFTDYEYVWTISILTNICPTNFPVVMENTWFPFT